MGCTNSSKKPEMEVDGHKTSENGGFKNLFYANTEFDISAGESEDDDEILSVKSITSKNNNNKQNSSKKIIEFPSGLTTANVNSSTTNSTLLDNRLTQTSI